MQAEPKIVLNCPLCGESIYETLEWFKQDYSICPVCDNQIAAEQFSVIITELEQALDADIEEMVEVDSHTGCCGKKSSCCGSKS